MIDDNLRAAVTRKMQIHNRILYMLYVIHTFDKLTNARHGLCCEDQAAALNMTLT